MKDRFVPGMKVTPYGSRVSGSSGRSCLCIFHFHLLPQVLRAGPGSKVQFKEGLPGPVARSLRSGVGSRRAGTHPEHQGLGWPLDLGLWEPFLVCTGGRGSESLNKKEAIKALCFLLWLQAARLCEMKEPINSFLASITEK